MKTRKRPLIAAIFPAVHDDCQSIVWPGVADYFRDNDIDLLTLIATSQNKVETFEPHYSIIQKLTQKLKLDGLIIYTGAFSDHFDNDELADFCNSLNACPMVCISQKVEDIKTILIDNSTGIKQTVRHLIKEHGCESFAFVKGHENHSESEERFNAFKDELIANGITPDPDLFFTGHFIKDSGIEAAKKLMDRKDLPDALLAVNDSTALGAISEFSKNHISVPGDIYVAGFDDVPEAVNHVPSLTTVRQPLYEIGRIACDSILKLMNGDADRSDVFVPTEFIPRQSCGCAGSHISESGFVPKFLTRQKMARINSREQFNEYCQQLLIQDNPSLDIKIYKQWIDTIIRSQQENILKLDIDNNQNLFIEKITSIIVQHISHGGFPGVWQDILSGLFSSKWLSLLNASEYDPTIEDVFNRLRMIVSDFSLRINLSEEMAKDDNRAFIRNIMLSLTTAFDIERVKYILKDNLPAIGIKSCHLVLYSTAREGVSISRQTLPKYSNLILSFNQNSTMVEVGDFIKFKTSDILPEIVWNTELKKNHILLPIVFEKRNFGYVIFQRAIDLPHYVYEELRIHIGNALRGHNLVNELREKSLRDELTGLYNRRGFNHLGNHLISQAKRRGSAVTMMYGDLNKLKYINDTFGHAEGDFAISKSALILKNTIRDQDVVARIGGDEFAIIAVDMTEKGAKTVIRRVEKAFEKFNQSGKKPYSVSISVGFSHNPDPEDVDIDDILEDADQMLGKIKKSRKPQ